MLTFYNLMITLHTLADPAMPISPTYVIAGYPLCKPFVNPLLRPLHHPSKILSYPTHLPFGSGWHHPQQSRSEFF